MGLRFARPQEDLPKETMCIRVDTEQVVRFLTTHSMSTGTGGTDLRHNTGFAAVSTNRRCRRPDEATVTPPPKRP